MSDADKPKPYRPIATWFMLIVLVVVALGFLGEWLRKKYG